MAGAELHQSLKPKELIRCRGRWVATVCFFAKTAKRIENSYAEVFKKTRHWKRAPVIFYTPEK